MREGLSLTRGAEVYCEICLFKKICTNVSQEMAGSPKSKLRVRESETEAEEWLDLLLNLPFLEPVKVLTYRR